MQKLLIATKNKGKIAEFSIFFSDLPVQILSLSDVGIDDDFEETGSTYKENSQGKALFYSKLSGLPSISDDGGLEIAALNNEPGVRSRRWLGHEASDEVLIEHMKKVSLQLPKDNRKATFITVVSFALPNGKVWSVESSVVGEIAQEPLMSLSHGYPYRSFFYLPKIKKFYHESELTKDEMEEYNHRYRAVLKLKSILKKTLGL